VCWAWLEATHAQWSKETPSHGVNFKGHVMHDKNSLVRDLDSCDHQLQARADMHSRASRLTHTSENSGPNSLRRHPDLAQKSVYCILVPARVPTFNSGHVGPKA